MQAVDINTAMTLVQNNAVNRATIECFDGRRWCIVLRGRAEFVLRSDRQNPRPFAKIETALGVLSETGLRHAELDFSKWDPDQSTLTQGKLA